MKINVLYLYYDIMNLYGENGNIRVMERMLQRAGNEVEISRKTITDKEIDFASYDFIYCGAGTENSRDVCLCHLKDYSESLKKAYEKGTVMLFTGNSYEMLGKEIRIGEDRVLEGLGLFDFTVFEQRRNRYTGDVTMKCTLLDGNFIGYINKCSEVQGISNHLFEVESVVGTVKEGKEGIHEKNFFGTQVIGPVTAKNPLFGEFLVKLITEGKK